MYIDILHIYSVFHRIKSKHIAPQKVWSVIVKKVEFPFAIPMNELTFHAWKSKLKCGNFFVPSKKRQGEKRTRHTRRRRRWVKAIKRKSLREIWWQCRCVFVTRQKCNWSYQQIDDLTLHRFAVSGVSCLYMMIHGNAMMIDICDFAWSWYTFWVSFLWS